MSEIEILGIISLLIAVLTPTTIILEKMYNKRH